MVVIWERGKEVCGVLRVDSDVYAAPIPKVQIATRIRRETETDVLDAGRQGRTVKRRDTFNCYPGAWLPFRSARRRRSLLCCLLSTSTSETKRKLWSLLRSAYWREALSANSVRLGKMLRRSRNYSQRYTNKHSGNHNNTKIKNKKWYRADNVQHQQCLNWFVQTVWWNLRGQCWDTESFIHSSYKETDEKEFFLRQETFIVAKADL